VLTLTEAAERLGVQPGTLRVQIAKVKLRAKKMGRDWFVSEREVERYMRENRRENMP
jgi:excisionase family DNA binding protein